MPNVTDRRLELDRLPCVPEDWMFCNSNDRFRKPESISGPFDRLVPCAVLARGGAQVGLAGGVLDVGQRDTSIKGLRLMQLSGPYSES
jgi:hypothetical protein